MANPTISLALFTLQVTFDATERAAFEDDPVGYIANSDLSRDDMALATQAVDTRVSPADRIEASKRIAEILAHAYWPFPATSSWTFPGPFTYLTMKIDLEAEDNGRS